MNGFFQRICKKSWKKTILGTSDAWSMIRLSHRPSNPGYFIVNWRISVPTWHTIKHLIRPPIWHCLGCVAFWVLSSNYFWHSQFSKKINSIFEIIFTVFIVKTYHFRAYQSSCFLRRSRKLTKSSRWIWYYVVGVK